MVNLCAKVKLLSNIDKFCCLIFNHPVKLFRERQKKETRREAGSLFLKLTWVVCTQFALFFLSVALQILTVSNHLFLFLVPEFIKHATKAFDEGDFIGNLIQHRIFFMAAG